MSLISRWWQNKGFGIESATDYAFLHDVIREKMPYYAYHDIERQHPHATRRELRVRKLIYRVRNAFRGEKVVVVSRDETAIPLGAGVRAVILVGIQLRQSTLWHEMLSLRHVITYDMKDIGIAIYHTDRHSQHYKILPL